jgi:uncharacterized protein (DUF1330 family)
MKNSLKLTSAVLGALALGMAATALHAQPKPHAYFVAEVTDIADPAAFEKIAQQAASKSSGAKYLRATNMTALAGTPPKAFVIIEFEDMDIAQAWVSAPEVKAALSDFDKSSKQQRFLFEAQQ